MRPAVVAWLGVTRIVGPIHDRRPELQLGRFACRVPVFARAEARAYEVALRRGDCSMLRMSPTRLRRLSTFPYIGPYRYSLTLCTFNRRQLFVDARIVETVRSQILRAGEICGFDVFAYCFMPDHLHLLVGGSMAPAHLPAFAQRAKQLSGYYGLRQAGAPIWQAGYFEHVLREDEDTRRVAAYILANPVRAGLVANPEDYPFSGSAVCSLAELLDYVADRRPE